MKTELDRKREKLARLIAEKNRTRLRAMGENPFLDYDHGVFERHSDFKRVLNDLKNADEEMLDTLITYHDPAGSGQPRYVW